MPLGERRHRVRSQQRNIGFQLAWGREMEESAVESSIVIHDGENAIFFGAPDDSDSVDPLELFFPGTASEYGPLVMSSLLIEHKFGVWHDFHLLDVFRTEDDPKSVCLQWRVTPKVLRQLEALAEGDYGTVVMSIAEMLEAGSDKVQAILRSLANDPADNVTSELGDSQGARVDPEV